MYVLPLFSLLDRDKEEVAREQRYVAAMEAVEGNGGPRPERLRCVRDRIRGDVGGISKRGPAEKAAGPQRGGNASGPEVVRPSVSAPMLLPLGLQAVELVDEANSGDVEVIAIGPSDKRVCGRRTVVEGAAEPPGPLSAPQSPLRLTMAMRWARAMAASRPKAILSGPERGAAMSEAAQCMARYSASGGGHGRAVRAAGRLWRTETATALYWPPLLSLVAAAWSAMRRSSAHASKA